jgi:hypothetical protein
VVGVGQGSPPVRERQDEAAAGALAITAPGEALEIAYSGQVALLRDPKMLADPGRAFKEAPRVAVELAIALQALSPMSGARSGPIGGHYEQHMSVVGDYSIDGVVRPLEGMGNRTGRFPRTRC